MLVPDLEDVKKSGPGENDRESFWMAGLEHGSAGRTRSPARETPKVAPNAGQLKDLCRPHPVRKYGTIAIR